MKTINKGGYIMKYKIEGVTLPVVICDLEANEQMVTECGSMSWMSPNIEMETSSNGGFGKAIGRMFAGESIFQNIYTSRGGAGTIAFASSFPGSIRAFEISDLNPLIVQKSAFLASERGVNLSIHIQKKFKTGFFGGEGFIMQKLSGNGIAFIEIDGHAVEYNLAPGQQIIVDSGYLVAMDATCNMDIVSVPGLKNKLLGGEGLFNTCVSGPGRVILQSMPVYRLANTLSRYMPVSGN